MSDEVDVLAQTRADGTPDELADAASLPPRAPSGAVSSASAPPAKVAPRTYVSDAEPARPPQPTAPALRRGGRSGDSGEGRSDSSAPTLFFVVGALLIAGLSGLVIHATTSAGKRLVSPHAEDAPQVAIADQAEVAYCTPQFKEVLQRVLHACGLEGGNSRHGCQPSDVKSFASISDTDFNALFTPLKDRGAVLLFDNAADELDEGSKKLLEERYLDRKGARYFFAVARASKVGNQAKNRALSHRRANSVKFFVQSVLPDPDLDKKFGQLWLGDEFAQLSEEFCSWPNSRPSEKCNSEAVNRSVFVSWVDCRL